MRTVGLGLTVALLSAAVIGSDAMFIGDQGRPEFPGAVVPGVFGAVGLVGAGVLVGLAWLLVRFLGRGSSYYE